MAAYGRLCVEFYDLDKPTAPPEALAFYLAHARRCGGRVLEPMCGSGRFLVPMALGGIQVDGVDSSPAMLQACRSHARRLGVDASVHLQDMASLELPHRYSMAFIPSGSIGLVTQPAALRQALARLRSHLEPNGRLFLELAAEDDAPQSATPLDPRTVQCPDGTSITYSCSAFPSVHPDTIRFSGTYTKCQGSRVLGSEEEELILRLYRPETVLAELAIVGFKSSTMSSASDLPFLAESGCTLIEACAEV